MKGRVKAGERSMAGNAGEYYAMAELLKRGIIAALTPRNTHSFDILATKDDNTVRVRVKTKSQEYANWQWSTKKDGAIFLNLSKKGDFVILVDLAKETKDMKFYVLPTHIIDTWLKEDFKRWVKTPGKTGKPHNASTTFRSLNQKEYAEELIKYVDGWEKLWS